jgi:sulfite exporter TauE/SafE/copper chaperone CopZ
MLQTHTFHLSGLHCSSCVFLTESTLKEIPGVIDVKTSLKEQNVRITGEFGEETPEMLAKRFTAFLKPHGYTVSLEKPSVSIPWAEFSRAVPLAILFVAGFLLLQKAGLINLIHAADVSYGTAFFIGLVASVSTCMAVVGGIVLSLSASFAKEGETVRPQALFHVGRLVSFFVLGGSIGALGSVFQFGATGILILSLLVAFVLILLGIRLLDVFPWANRFSFALPARFGTAVHGLKEANHWLTPLLVGIATFFLPCGFTQSMQIYTLTTGSFWKGGFTMLAFALGTFPILALLSFSSIGLQKRTHNGVFFKTAGLIVLFFGLFNLVNALVGAGILPPFFSL